MKKMVFILLITCLLLVSCQPSDQPDHTETYTNVILDGQDITDVLKEGMHYDELCARIGKEDRDVGSGIIIGEWDLDDGSILRIYFMYRGAVDNQQQWHVNRWEISAPTES